MGLGGDTKRSIVKRQRCCHNEEDPSSGAKIGNSQVSLDHLAVPLAFSCLPLAKVKFSMCDVSMAFLPASIRESVLARRFHRDIVLPLSLVLLCSFEVVFNLDCPFF